MLIFTFSTPTLTLQVFDTSRHEEDKEIQSSSGIYNEEKDKRYKFVFLQEESKELKLIRNFHSSKCLLNICLSFMTKAKESVFYILRHGDKALIPR